MLKIALLGAPHTGKSALASGLNSAVKASAWPAVIHMETDHPLLSAALPSYDLVLLTGLESAAEAQPDTRPATSQQVREAADASIRAALADARMAYRVLYGRSDERLVQACEAIQSLLAPMKAPARPGLIRAPQKPTPWVWLCDKCSDPQCEHRLLTALLAQRAQAA
jgi:nicotinamide riboside kinase